MPRNGWATETGQIDKGDGAQGEEEGVCNEGEWPTEVDHSLESREGVSTRVVSI